MIAEQQVRSIVKDELRAEHLLNLIDVLKNEHDVLSGVHRNIKWDYLTGVPENFPPVGHNHDDRYYTEDEIDALLLTQNEFKELTDTPANYTGYGDYVVAVKSTEDGLEFIEAPQPGAHASTHQADGSDPLNNLLLGASPYVKWQSGNLLLQTTLADTNTGVQIKGQGSGVGQLALYDQDDAEWLVFYCSLGVGVFETGGTTPSSLNLQHSVAQDINFWAGITAGNPDFNIHGIQTGVGLKYGKQWIDTSGIYNLQGEVGLKLNFA